MTSARKPRYTDRRYQHGYTPAAQTDIRKTFARRRAELKAEADQKILNEAEVCAKVAPMWKSK